jgi:hypothetical protein
MTFVRATIVEDGEEHAALINCKYVICMERLQMVTRISFSVQSMVPAKYVLEEPGYFDAQIGER